VTKTSSFSFRKVDPLAGKASGCTETIRNLQVSKTNMLISPLKKKKSATPYRIYVLPLFNCGGWKQLKHFYVRHFILISLTKQAGVKTKRIMQHGDGTICGCRLSTCSLYLSTHCESAAYESRWVHAYCSCARLEHDMKIIMYNIIFPQYSNQTCNAPDSRGSGG
jgi:hypothetical protein